MNTKISKLEGGLSKLSQAAARSKDSVSGTIILISPDDLYEEDNPRTEFNQVLIESFAEDFLDPNVGQTEAIHVYPKDAQGKYRVQHGASRLRAAKIAQKTKPDFKLKAIVDHSLSTKDDLENFWDKGSNNIKRDNMTLRDRANFIGNYMEKAKRKGVHVTQADVARRLGLGGASAVSRLLKLRDMSPEVEAIYESGVTEDIEALAMLIEIQKDTPDLFNQLAEMKDLDRATIRKARKAGEIIESKKSPEADKDETALVGDFAHAQSNILNKTESITGDTEENVYTIPFLDYEFKTGRVQFVVKQTLMGFAAAVETFFEHGINEDGALDKAPIWKTESEAVSYAKKRIVEWAELVTSDKDAVSLEEYQDISGYLQSLKPASKAGNNTSGSAASSGRKKKPDVLQATIFGTVKGEDCILLTKVTHEVIGEDAKGTSDFIYVQIGDEIKIAKMEDFVMKSISYRS